MLWKTPSFKNGEHELKCVAYIKRVSHDSVRRSLLLPKADYSSKKALELDSQQPMVTLRGNNLKFKRLNIRNGHNGP